MNLQRGTILTITYGIASIILLLYSYTQVDLHLYVTSNSFIQSVLSSFQHVGYYNRPLSLFIYITLLILFFGLYLLSIKYVKEKLFDRSHIWKIVLVVTTLLVISYPAFSYDIFNYMFDAKTVLQYQKNPYFVMPLNFAGIDPWLSFMRWTHVPTAYAPLWILMALIPYIFGFGVFLLILWNTKIMIALFYLLSIVMIGKIMDKVDTSRANLAIVLFALNPLIIFESLVSSHNDIVMMALILFALLLLIEKKIVSSFFLFSLSAAVKMVTIFIFPLYILRSKFKDSNYKKERIFMLIMMIIGLLAVLTKREIMPWYLVWIMPFIVLLPRYSALILLTIAFSLGLLLRYAPYLYYGHWDYPVTIIKTWVTLLPIVFVGIYLIAKKSILRKNL